MRFSERQDFKLDDSSIVTEDYKKMRVINRHTLAKFLRERFDEDTIESESDEDESWDDECIDEEVKLLFGNKENGQSISLDIIAHMEYFYNTLDCNYKTVNPFECSNSAQLYPALHYKAEV